MSKCDGVNGISTILTKTMYQLCITQQKRFVILLSKHLSFSIPLGSDLFKTVLIKRFEICLEQNTTFSFQTLLSLNLLTDFFVLM